MSHPRLATALVFCLAVLFTASAGFSQTRRVITGGEGLPFSDGVVVGNTLYIAGQEGTDQAGKLKPGGIDAEAQAALDNIAGVVKKAGFQMKDIVAVTVYLADIHDFAAMNQVYKRVMPDPKPTRATIQAAALVNNARIEISAIAVKTK